MKIAGVLLIVVLSAVGGYTTGFFVSRSESNTCYSALLQELKDADEKQKLFLAALTPRGYETSCDELAEEIEAAKNSDPVNR